MGNDMSSSQATPAAGSDQSEDSRSLFGGSILDPIRDPYRAYARLRDEKPGVRMEGWTATTHLVTRYEDVAAGLKDSALFSARGNARGIGLVMGRTILEMEGAEHVRHRRIATPSFSPRALRGAVERDAERIAHEMIDAFVERGRADLVSEFTFTYPLRVLAGIIGVPIADFDEFHRWAIDLISVAKDPARGFAAGRSIVEYLQPVLEARRADPREDLLSALVTAEVEGERLAEEEVLSFLRLLLPAGAETTYRLTGSLLFALLSHPEQAGSVRTDPALLDEAIEETLRWESPVQLASREATRDVILHGHRIPAGDLVAFSVGSANRDERQFGDPDRFDLHRANKRDHVAFGLGEHFCLGSHLARLETRIAATAILARLPRLRFASEQPAPIEGIAFRSPPEILVRFD